MPRSTPTGPAPAMHLCALAACVLAGCATAPRPAPGSASAPAAAPAGEGAATAAAEGKPSCHSTAPAPADDTPSGGAAPDFVLRDVDGANVRLSDLRGRVVLLDFWATWCVPCEAALPRLQELYRRYEPQGLTILGVAMDGPETLSSVPAFVRRHELTFPVLVDEETTVTSLYNPRRSAPLTVIVDREGRIATVHQGFIEGDQVKLEHEITRLLGAK